MFLPWMYFLYMDLIKNRYYIWLFYGLTFAILSEGIQYILPYRTFNINDLLANLIGIILSNLVFLIPRRLLLKEEL